MNGTITSSATPTLPSSLTWSRSFSNTSVTLEAATRSTATTTATRVYDSDFTGITVTGDRNAESCYSLPTALANLTESPLNSTTRTAPYIDSLFFDKSGRVKYVQVRDTNDTSFIVDSTDPQRFAITTSAGLSLVLDNKGIHLATKDCGVTASIDIPDFFQQINKLTNTTCPRADMPTAPSGVLPQGAAQELDPTRSFFSVQSFYVILNIKDQCGQGLSEDVSLDVKVGNTTCENWPGTPGAFVASCGFPTASAGQTRCEGSVQLLIDDLTRGSLQGLCPDLETVWTLLLNQLTKDVLTKTSLFQPFIDAGLKPSPWKIVQLSRTLDTFLGLWRRSTAQLASNNLGPSVFRGLFGDYAASRDIWTEACRPLQLGSAPQNLTVSSRMADGADIYPSTPPLVIDTLTTAPNGTRQYSLNATDPEQKACCPNPGTCTRDDSRVYYDRKTRVPGSDCICGTTMASGSVGVPSQGVAFRTALCRDYPACNATSPCLDGNVCLLDSCCGFNICVNATECHSPPKLGRGSGRRSIELWTGGDVPDTTTSGGDIRW